MYTISKKWSLLVNIHLFVFSSLPCRQVRTSNVTIFLVVHPSLLISMVQLSIHQHRSWSSSWLFHSIVISSLDYNS